MKRKYLIFTLILFCSFIYSCNSPESGYSAEEKPNIVIVYLDDLGYGDLSCYGASEITTPNIDNLGKNGLLFTDAHATSATCTPSRYSLLTGVYPWRNKKAKILPGTAPLIIDTTQQTLPQMLKQAGYNTAIIGKWHLGLGNDKVDWNKHVSPGPNEVGFDYSYIMAATQDRVPTVYLENGFVVGLDQADSIEISYDKNFDGEPTGLLNPELLTTQWSHGHNNSIVNGISRIGFMQGGTKAKWNDIDMADHFLEKVIAYIKKPKKEPFFLYYVMQQPHVPLTPHPRFVGKSGMGPRGDVIIEADWCIGELFKTLKEEKLLENTLIIFSSDNGPVLNDGYKDNAVEKIGKHDPFGGMRGGKYSLFEAGTRVPFITYWKGKIAPGKSNALVCQIDLLASLASLVNQNIYKTDSKNLIDVFLGENKNGRSELIIEATSRTALRKGDWLMIPPYNKPLYKKNENIELGNGKSYKLFNLKNDIKQEYNLSEVNPEKLQEMIVAYDDIIDEQ